MLQLCEWYDMLFCLSAQEKYDISFGECSLDDIVSRRECAKPKDGAATTVNSP